MASANLDWAVGLAFPSGVLVLEYSGSVDFSLTVSWSTTDIEVDQPLALDDFDQEGDVLALALITANDSALDLYDSPNSLGSASADSDLNITNDLLITRIRRITSNTRLAIFRSGTDNFDDLFGTGGTYENATFYIQTADRVISLPPAQVLDISESRMRFNIPSGDQAAFAGIGGSDLFIFAVTTPGVSETGAVDFPLTLSWSVTDIEVEEYEIGAVEFPLTLSWSVSSIEVVEYEIGAVEFPLTLSWSVDSIEVEEYNVGAVSFPITLSWSVDSIEVEEYEIGAVEFPLTLAWSVDSIEVDQPDVEIGSVDFPLTLAWSVDSIEIVAVPSVEIEAVEFPLTLAWSVTDIEVEEYNVGAVDFPVTLAWSVAGIEVEEYNIGSVTFPVTVTWSVTDISIVTIPSVDIGSVDFPLTLTWSVDAIEVDQPDVEVGAVDFPLTLAWSVDSIEVDQVLTLADFNQEGETLVLALITAGSSEVDIYRPDNNQGSASADSDLDVNDDFTISRIRRVNSSTRIAIVRSGTDDFNTLFDTGGQYANATFYIQTPNHVIDLAASSRQSIATSAIRFDPTGDDLTAFQGISGGDLFIFAITVPSVTEVGAVEFPLTLAWSVDSIEVEEYNIGAVTFPLTLSWSVDSIEVAQPTVDIGAVTFPLTLEWSVAEIEVDQPDVEIGAVTFPLTLAWSVGSIAALNPQTIGAVTYAVTVSWSVDSIETFMEAVVVVSDALGRRGQVYPSNSAPMSHYRRGQSLPNNITV